MDNKKELSKKERLIIHMKNVRKQLVEVLEEDKIKKIQCKNMISESDNIDDLLSNVKRN